MSNSRPVSTGSWKWRYKTSKPWRKGMWKRKERLSVKNAVYKEYLNGAQPRYQRSCLNSKQLNRSMNCSSYPRDHRWSDKAMKRKGNSSSYKGIMLETSTLASTKYWFSAVFKIKSQLIQDIVLLDSLRRRRPTTSSYIRTETSSN